MFVVIIKVGLVLVSVCVEVMFEVGVVLVSECVSRQKALW